MIDPQTIRKLHPFNKLNNNDFNRIISNCKICSYRKGKYIYYEGDKAGSFYFILEGTVGLYKWVDLEKDKLIKEIMFGKWLASSEVILDEPYFFDAKANSDVLCLNIPMNSLKQFLAILEINNSLINSIANWNYEYNSLLINKTCLTVLKKYITESDSKIIVITQDKLSSLLGYTRECINKNLKKLESSGVIKLERSKIIKL